MKRRRGILKVELIVSCIVLMTTMTFVVPLCFRINLIWKDVTQHQIAVNELSNHLETLTQLSPTEAKQTIVALTPSDTCNASLPESVIEGKLQTDNLGTRVELKLDWKRPQGGQPVQLVGWLIPPDDSTLIEEASE